MILASVHQAETSHWATSIIQGGIKHTLNLMWFDVQTILRHNSFFFCNTKPSSTPPFSNTCFVIMDRRKEELEKKRQKLAELRRAREERRALLESQSTQSSSVSVCTVYIVLVVFISKLDNHYFNYWQRQKSYWWSCSARFGWASVYTKRYSSRQWSLWCWFRFLQLTSCFCQLFCAWNTHQSVSAWKKKRKYAWYRIQDTDKTHKHRAEARLSMLSMSSQPNAATNGTTPHYVAELTESQAFVADIPPLVNR